MRKSALIGLYILSITIVIFSLITYGGSYYITHLKTEDRIQLLSKAYPNLHISQNHQLDWHGTDITLKAENISWHDASYKVEMKQVFLAVNIFDFIFYTRDPILKHIDVDSLKIEVSRGNQKKEWNISRIIPWTHGLIHIKDLTLDVDKKRILQASIGSDDKNIFLDGHQEESYIKAIINRSSGVGYIEADLKNMGEIFNYDKNVNLSMQVWLDIGYNNIEISGNIDLNFENSYLHYLMQGNLEDQSIKLDGNFYSDHAFLSRVTFNSTIEGTEIFIPSLSVNKIVNSDIVTYFHIPIDNAQGLLKDVYVNIKHQNLAWNIAAKMKNLGYQYQDIDIHNISGKILASSDSQVRIDLDGKNVFTHIPDLIPKSISMPSLQGTVYAEWTKDRQAIKVTAFNLNALSEYGKIQTHAVLNIPLNKSFSYTDLALSLVLEGGKLKHKNGLIPLFIDKQILSWIYEHSIEGYSPKLHYLYRGNFIVGDKNFVSRLDIEAVDSIVEFSKSWPKVHVQKIKLFVVDDEYMSVTGTDGELQGTQIKQAHVFLSTDQLKVEAKGQGNSPNLLSLLELSEVNETIVANLKSLDIQNTIKADIKLLFPLDNISLETLDVDIVAHLDDNSIVLSPKISVENISGDVIYRNKVFSGQAKALLLNSPLNINISQFKDDISIDAKSYLSLREIVKHVVENKAMPNRFSGSSNFHAYASINLKKSSANYGIKSNLSGSSIDFSPVYSKNSDQLLAWHAEISWDGEIYNVAGKILDHTYGLSASSTGDLLAVGWNRPPPKIEKNILNMDIALKEGVLTQYVSLLRSINENSSENGDIKAKISVDTVDIYGFAVQDIVLDYMHTVQGKTVTLSSTLATGTYNYFSSGATSRLDIAKINILNLPKNSFESFSVPHNISPVLISIRELMIKGKNLGEWQGELSIDKGNIKISALSLAMPNGLNLEPSNFTWDTSNRCYLPNIKASFSDAADITQSLLGHVSFSSSKGTVTGNLIWNNCSMFDIEDLQADISFEMFDGNTGVELNEDARATLGILSIFNLHNWERILLLNFTSFSESDSYYDRIYGSFHLERGVISAQEKNGLHIRMPSASFDYSGDIDILKDHMKGEVDLKFTLGKTLPVVIGAVTGGLPIAALLYLITPSDLLDDLAHKKYVIEGRLDAPNIKDVSSK